MSSVAIVFEHKVNGGNKKIPRLPLAGGGRTAPKGGGEDAVLNLGMAGYSSALFGPDSTGGTRYSSGNVPMMSILMEKSAYSYTPCSPSIR